MADNDTESGGGKGPPSDVKIISTAFTPPDTLTVSGTVEGVPAPDVAVTASWTAPPAGSPKSQTVTSSGGTWSVTISGVGSSGTVQAKSGASIVSEPY